MSSALFQLDDDEDDALFASVPMPDYYNDNPAATGTLSYGAGDQEASTVPKQPLYQQRSAQQFERQSFRSLEVSNEMTMTPVAQSTQLSTRQQQQQSTLASSRGGKSTHRRSAGKFPGPAGRLPRLRVDPNRGSANSFAAAARQLIASAAAAASAKREERAAAAGASQAGAAAGQIIVSSSQTSTVSNSSSQFGLEDEASWRAAAADLGPGLCRYLSRYSIAEAVRLVAAGSLPRNKVPAMLVMIETIDPSAVDCVVTVKDYTGRLQASLHRQLFRDLRDGVQAGSVLVLRRVTLFSADQRSYYLNITMDNLVRVYDRAGSPLVAASASSANSANSNALLSDDEVRQLEAECMRPRTPPAVQAQQQQAVTSHRRWSSVDQTPTGAGLSRPQPPKRSSDSRFCDYSSAGSSAAAAAAASPSSFTSNNTPGGAKRFRFTPISHSNRPQMEQQQQQQRCHSHPQQSRQYQQQRQTDTRVLKDSYRDAFDDNMDEILASALDDI